MHDRHDYDCTSADLEVNAKWKSAHERPTCLTPHHRVRERVLGNPANRMRGFVQELLTKPGTVRLVPDGCHCQILVRLLPESDRVGHSFLRISAMTSSAGRPTLPSAS